MFLQVDPSFLCCILSKDLFLPDGFVALHSEGGHEVDGRAEDGASQRKEHSGGPYANDIHFGVWMREEMIPPLAKKP